MRRFRSGLLLGGGLVLAACSDSTEETVQLKGLDSTLAAERKVDQMLEQVGGNADSVFRATQGMATDAVVARVAVGMTIRALPALIGKGPMTAEGTDTLQVQDGFRRTFSVVAPDLVTVIWFRKQPGTPKEPISRAVETPIVFKNDVVIGTGWAYYDEVRASFNLPEVPPRQ